jgi:hypothetical protein
VAQRQEYERVVVRFRAAPVDGPLEVHGDFAGTEERVIQRQEYDLIRPGLVHQSPDLVLRRFVHHNEQYSNLFVFLIESKKRLEMDFSSNSARQESPKQAFYHLIEKKTAHQIGAPFIL